MSDTYIATMTISFAGSCERFEDTFAVDASNPIAARWKAEAAMWEAHGLGARRVNCAVELAPKAPTIDEAEWQLLQRDIEAEVAWREWDEILASDSPIAANELVELW